MAVGLPHLVALVPVAFGSYIANERFSLPLMRERWLPHLADWYLSFDAGLWHSVTIWLPSFGVLCNRRCIVKSSETLII